MSVGNDWKGISLAGKIPGTLWNNSCKKEGREGGGEKWLDSTVKSVNSSTLRPPSTGTLKTQGKVTSSGESFPASTCMCLIRIDPQSPSDWSLP